MIISEEILLKNIKNKYDYFVLKGGEILAEKKKPANNFEELTKQFDNIDTKYELKDKRVKLTDNLNLTKLSDIDVNDDEIAKVAKDSLQQYYKTNIDAINNNNLKEVEKLNNKIASNSLNAKELKQNIANNVSDAKEATNNNAIKRGLARSSIVINQLNAFDNKQLEEFNKIDKQLTEDMNNINAEIADLNVQKEKALNDFDISYASKLNEKIYSLKNELEEKQAEVTKYNNKIAQIEADYNKEKVKFNNSADQQDFNNYLDISEFLAKYGQYSLDTIKFSEKFDDTYAYLSTLPKEEAKKIIKENETYLKNSLGNAYFSNLNRLFNV